MAVSVGLSRRLKFGVLVHELSRLRRKAIDQRLQPLGITGAQWWLLTYISLRPGLSQARLADELNIGKVALGGLIERMMKLDLIDRRPDEQDKRVNLIFLSKGGKAMVKEITIVSSSMQDEALEGISKEELEVAMAVLVRMKDNLEKATGIDTSVRSGSLV
jgi:MarR family transcriptional regulator, transcriptional regulator for hemolysin